MTGTRGGNRGQPVQIGVLLLFAFLIIALALFQAVLVPQENGQVEFNHNKDVQDDMVDLRSDLLRTAATGEPRSSDVRLGTTYPSRTLLLNPAPPAGTLRTTYRGDVAIENARATATTGVSDYWNGTARRFRTKTLLYEPSYNVYDDPPETALEASVLYNRFEREGRTVAVTNQSIVTSRTITLTAIMGDYDESTDGSVAVDPRVVSAANRTVTVTSDGAPITLRIPTRQSEKRWRSLLSGEFDDPDDGTDRPDRYVRRIDCPDAASPSDPCGTLVVELEQGASYDLRLGAVGVGARDTRSDGLVYEARASEAAYLVTAGGDGVSIAEGERHRVTVEVRDRLDNPVPGETVTVQQPTVGYIAGAGSHDGPVTVTTDRNGRATVTYVAPRNVRRNARATFRANLTDGDPADLGDPKTVAFGVVVEDDSDRVSNDDYARPLLTAVEPTPLVGDSASTEFVRVWFPPSVDGQEFELRDSDGTSDDPLAPGGESVYFRTGTFTGPCSSADNTQGLGGVTLDDAGDTVELVRVSDGRVVDRLTYDEPGEVTIDDDGVGVRLEEDGAYVDSNVSMVDWETVTAAAACGDDGSDTDGPPTVEALSASANLARTDRQGNTIDTYTDTVTFTYRVTDDRDQPTVTFDVAASDAGSQTETLTSPNGTRTFASFGENPMSGTTDGTIDVTVTVADGNPATADVTCTGTLDDAGATVSREGGGLTCSTS